MKKQDVVELFTIFRENNPRPQTELGYSSVFELLISVVLSAQATDVSVNKATAKLCKPLFSAIVCARLNSCLAEVKSISNTAIFYPQKKSILSNPNLTPYLLNILVKIPIHFKLHIFNARIRFW